MIFTTSSGSIYEIDQSAKQIRLLHGQKNAKHRISVDWKSYSDVSSIEAGQAVLIVWDKEESFFQNTLTSPVVEINPTFH